jgi:hypothetical protein
LTASYGTNGLDSTISFKMSLMNFTRPPSVSTNYDLAQVAQHEVNEVLGCSSDLPFSEISPIDLFRYTTNLVRTYTTSGDNAYFSVDGTNLIARFNMHAGGDYSDWYSFKTNWLPSGQFGNFPQVQDAYSRPNTALDDGSNELAMLDVVGWTLAVTPNVVPTLKIVRSGVNQFTFSWTNTATGYVLQENTNLLTSATWIASTTGSTNPAVIVSTATRKFYRLYKAAAPSMALAKPAAFDLSVSPAQLRKHAIQPSQP